MLSGVNCDETNAPIWVVKYGNSKHLNSKSFKWEDQIQDKIKWYGIVTASQWLHEYNPLNSSNSKSAGGRLEVVLIEEIQLTPWDVWNYVRSGSTYRLLEDFSRQQ